MGSANSSATVGSTAKSKDKNTSSMSGSGAGQAEGINSRLQTENEELRRVSQYRSIFLARLAHELRTPLTSILGFSEILLSQEKLTDAQRSFCERIQSSAHQLQNSLNQLSDLARLEAGQAELACEKLSVAELLRESLGAVARRAEKKNVEISSDVNKDLTMVSDRGRVRQVIYNVLAYAITRSPEDDTVEISAAANPQGVLLTVQDNGEPLANPSEIGTLDAANDKSGTGELGLAIARQNIQMLGGTLAAENLTGGLRLEIQLPLEPPQSPPT